MRNELPETAEGMHARETEHELPLGWLLLFAGLVLWGVYYFLMYTPAVSGWSQEKAYQQSIQK